MRNFRGLLMGLLSGISFGLIPLFSLPLLLGGMPYISVLFFRFMLAASVLGLIIVARGGRIRISPGQVLAIAPLSLLYAASSIFLLWGYTYVAASVATPIHFLYPVIVACIMGAFFGEQITFKMLFAVVLALGGVFMLSTGKDGGAVSLLGVVIVVISAFAYAIYIVAVRHSRTLAVEPLQLTFYVMTMGAFVIYIWALLSNGGVGRIGSWGNFGLLVGLAIVPTVVSNLALLDAIGYIGSTSTAILGAMEPMTAVAVGVVVFSEPFSQNLFAGVVMIIAAVSLVILGKAMNRAWRKIVAKFQLK